MKYKAFLILGLLLSPLFSFATSGACSYHGGVNCSAGASFAGKVQCNDGWINSSVYFSSASECSTTYIPTCCLPTKTNYYCEQSYALNIRSGMTSQNDQCLENQKQADEKYSDDYATYKKCFLEMGYNVDTQQIDMSLINQREEEKKQATKDAQEKAQADANMKCIQKNGDWNIHSENGYCVCNTGYVLDSSNLCNPPKINITAPIIEPQEVPTVPIQETKKNISAPEIILKTIPKNRNTFWDVPKKEVKKVVPIQVEQPKIEQQVPLPKKTFWQKIKGLFSF